MQIPPEARVCYSCWVAARRNVQRAQNIDKVREKTVSAQHHQNVFCAMCAMSLFRRQTHNVPSGPERDELAARIYPREVVLIYLIPICIANNIEFNINAFFTTVTLGVSTLFLYFYLFIF